MKHIPTTETKFIRQFSLGSRKIKRPLTPPPTRDSTIILEELLWPERVGLPFLKAREHANRSGGRASEASACSRPPLSLSLSRTHREVLLADAAHREAVVAGVHGAGQYLVQVHGGVPVPQQTPQSAHTRARTPPCAFPLGAAAAEERRLCRAPEAADARSGPAAHPEQGSRGLKGAAPRCSAPVTAAQVKRGHRLPNRPSPELPGEPRCPHATPEQGQRHSLPKRPRSTSCSHQTSGAFTAARPPPSPAATARDAAPASAPKYRETFLCDPEGPAAHAAATPSLARVSQSRDAEVLEPRPMLRRGQSL